MKFANATNLNRKSGGAQWRACPERSRTGIAVSFSPSPRQPSLPLPAAPFFTTVLTQVAK